MTATHEEHTPETRRPRPIFFLIGLVIAAVLAVGLFTSYSPTGTAGPPEVGSGAPAFSLPSSANSGATHAAPKVGIPKDGGAHGTPIVLLFFASWCPPCRTEVPMLAAAYQEERRPRNNSFAHVAVLGIDGLDTTGGRAFADNDGVTFPVATDAQMTVTQSIYGFLADPAAVFITGSGRIEQIDRGAISPAKFAAGERALLKAS